MKRGFGIAAALIGGGCALVQNASVGASPAIMQAPLTSAGCIDLSGNPRIRATGEGILYSMPSIVGHDYGLTLELPGPEICVHPGPNVPTRTTRHVRVVVPDSKASLVDKLKDALGYTVTVRGTARPTESEGRAGFEILAERITILGYPGDLKAGFAPITEEMYSEAARHCGSRDVIRMRPGVQNMFFVGGLNDRRGRPLGERQAKRIECVREYLKIPSKNVTIVLS